MSKQYTTEDLIKIVEVLRGENGCPWDKVQTHDSIKKDMIEEVYEAIDALDKGDDKMFANELGDVLLQVVFHSQIARERGVFDFNTVLNEICEKLISRHTHVFGEDKAGDEDEALTNWERNKKKEKKLDTGTDVLNDVPKYLPALMRAAKVQKKAETFGKVYTDEEIYSEIKSRLDGISVSENKESEYEKLLFYVVALGRKLGLTPEISLANATDRFISECSGDENFR